MSFPSCSISAKVAVRLAVLLLVMGTLAVPAVAQTPFAIYNIGQRITPDDARIMGRGGWGMAVYDSLNPGFKNIASLGALRHVAIKFTGYGESMDSKDSSGKRMNSRVLSPDVRAAVPVMKGRLALTAGYSVYRSNQYHTRVDTIWGEAFGDTIVGNEQFDRIGNRYKVPLGAALTVFKGLSVSGAVNLEHGNIKDTVNNFFVFPTGDSGPIYSPNVKETYDEFHGTSQTWGVILDPVSWLQLGASWTPAHRIEVDRKLTVFGLNNRAASTYAMEMPDEYMAGIQLGLPGRYRLGADAQYQAFSDFVGPEAWMADMEDEYTLSAGFDRLRGTERRGGLSNLPLRLGVSLRRWAYRVNGEVVDEKTFTIGTGFPFRQNLGVLDVGVSYSMVGDLDKNGLESKIWRLTITVTGLERWW
jgi:hypothetical protein